MKFKLDSNTAEALNQILLKEYLRPFQLDPRRKIIIGINFSSAKRQIDG